MKKPKAFVRTLWGIHDHKGRRYYKRRSKIDSDIRFLLHNKYDPHFVTYVFGTDNYKYLTDQGFECVLVDKRPIIWDMDKEQFRHKLEAFKCGMEEHNQIVFLDWDCLPVKRIPHNFWKTLKSKGDFQAILRMYHRTKAQWRRKDRRKIPCASFVYFGDEQVPKDLIQMWENCRRPWSEEVVMARYMDKISGGWQGTDYYWDHYEPDFFVLGEGRAFTPEQLKTKNCVFRHFNSKAIKSNMDLIRKGRLKDFHTKKKRRH